MAYNPESSGTIYFYADSLTTYDLEGTILARSDSLGMPVLIATGQDRIYVGDTKASKSLLVFDRGTGNFIASHGPPGSGPREIGYLWAMDFKPGADGGWLFDFQSRKMLFFDGASLTGKSIDLKDTGLPMGPVWVKGDSIASVGMYTAGRLALHGPDGSFGRFIGPDPPGRSRSPRSRTATCV